MNRVGALLLWGSLGLSAPAWAQDGASDSTLVFSLQGTVYDKDTQAPLKGAKVNVVGTDGSSFSALTDENGAFKFEESESGRHINGNTGYSIQVDIDPYHTLKDQISTVGLKESTTFVKEYYLQIGCTGGGDPWSPLVYFPWNSAALDNAADSILLEIVGIMQDNPGLVIRISSRYESSESIEVAAKRCVAVRNKLVKHGVQPMRLALASDHGSPDARSSMTYIETMDDPQEREAHRAMNRVVEFVVLRTDWKE